MPPKIYDESEVAKHNTEQDCWLIIGDDSNGGEKVYDVTKYLNDHPGGPEIMLEFAGKDANSMFEDIGHSTEARTMLQEYFIGNLKVDPNKPKAPKASSQIKSKEGGGLNPLALLFLIIAIAGGYYYTQMN